MNPSWITLTGEKELEEAINQSYQHPVVIFKHSTRCEISRMALRRLERNWDFKETPITLYYLDLLAYKDISNRVAEISGIQHESPQIILYLMGKPIFHTSHSGISTEVLKQQLVS